ncbi:uncharacterized protein ACRADG_002640 [Cochliomyia hominivorax]
MILKSLQILTIINCLSSTSIESSQEQLYNTEIANIIQQINRERKLEINILINYDKLINNDNIEIYREFLRATQIEETPKLIITQQELNITPIYKTFTDLGLTVAWLKEDTLSDTLSTIDQLMWTLHFKDIFLIYQGHKESLFEIFQKCWNYGFTSVLLWFNDHLYTYHPYPQIKVIKLNHISEFYNKNHLNNFQGYNMSFPLIYYPPYCFSYNNSHGQLLRVGYFYKWIELFLNHYNATIIFSQISHPLLAYDVLKTKLIERNFSFAVADVGPTEDFASSRVLFISKMIIMVPSSQEIAHNLYLTKPFDEVVWFIIFLNFLLFVLLFLLINIKLFHKYHLDLASGNSLKILLFLSVDLKMNSFFLNSYLCLLFLFTGVFLTNFYSSSLSSIITSKIYEPELRELKDLKENNLPLYLHTANMPTLSNLNLPQFLTKRIITGNNSDFRLKRQSLDMNYLYLVQSEKIADFILFQQKFMKKPKAKILKHIIRYRPFAITLPHRSPVIDQFNRYLSYIRENGILDKILADTNFHGWLSGNLKMMVDEDFKIPLNLKYFQYAFMVWGCGLIGAFITFLIECFHRQIRIFVAKLINKVVK